MPESWKSGVSCPILKPGKDRTQIPSCRPITMLSSIGKLMERTIQQRLEYFLETNKIFDNTQLGFRKGYGTTEALATIINHIDAEVDEKKFCIAVYVDLESAFDRVWHGGVLSKLKELNTPTYLLKWIKHYFQDRKISVRLGEFTTLPKPLTVGVPQGAVLSPMLFNVMMHDLPKDDNIKVITYADDITLLTSDLKIENARQKMQNYITRLSTWLEKWQMVVNPQKCSYQIFTLKKLLPNITIRMYNHNMRFTNTQRVLGVTLDAPRLTLEAHFKSIIEQCKRRIHIIRALSSTNWGCSRTLLRQIYIAYIRSKIEYGSFLFRDIKPKFLQKLEVMQNDAMRCILGARKTSPILSLQIESFLPPIELRFQYLYAKWYIKCRNIPNSHEIITKSCKMNANRIFSSMNIPYFRQAQTPIVSELPPWIDLSERVIIEFPMSDKNIDAVGQQFDQYTREAFPNSIMLFTDGSKLMDGSTSAAVYVPHRGEAETYKMNPAHNIIGAELFAIMKALEMCEDFAREKIVIFSDCQSALQVIRNNSSPKFRSVVRPIQRSLLRNDQIILHWVRAHCGIEGNETVDGAANIAHTNKMSTVSFLTINEYNSFIWEKFIAHWEKRWRELVVLTGKGKFMLELRQHITESDRIEISPRKMECAITRLRIGHAGVLNHLYRFEMTDSPLCERCKIPETIKHFLMHCPKYYQQREILCKTFQNLKICFNLADVLGLSNIPLNDKKEILISLCAYLSSTGRVSGL